MAFFTYGFILLCVCHLFSQRPLWHDENSVYRNITEMSYSQLFGPLKPVQSYPRVYLCLVKGLSDLFNQHVIALRTLPFLFMIGAVFVWRRVYAIILKDDYFAMLLLLLSWLCSYRLIYYAAELKPYSMDVLTSGLYAWYLIYISNQKSDKLCVMDYTCSICLPMLLYFSYASIFLFWIVPLYFCVRVLSDRKYVGIALISSLAAIVHFFIFYKIDIQHSITPQGVKYWNSYFLCVDSFECFFKAFGEGIKSFGVFWWATQKGLQRAAIIFIPMLMYGLIRYGFGSLVKGRLKVIHLNSLGAIIFLEFLAFGVMHKYPFSGERLSLFFAPILFYWIVRALKDIYRVKYLGKILNVYFVGYCLICLGVSINTYVGLYMQ